MLILQRTVREGEGGGGGGGGGGAGKETKIIYYIYVHFLLFSFERFAAHNYVVIFKFIKDISDLFVYQVTERAYFCIYFVWNVHCLVVSIHCSFPGLRDCVDKCIIFEQQPAIFADRLFDLFITHDVTIDPKIL